MKSWVISVILILLGNCLYAQLPVVLMETFSNNNYGWIESETATHKLEVRNGKYYMDAPEGGWMTYISPYIEKDKDFTLEATFTQIDGYTDNGIGLIWAYDGKEALNDFIFTTDGTYRISCSDCPVKVANNWCQTDAIKPMGKENRMKVEQRKGNLYFYLNGTLLTTAKSFPWRAKNIGFVAYTKMHLMIDDFKFTHDIKINLQKNAELPGPKENIGPHVNSPYDEVSPKISLDGKTLYFGRKQSPDNIGGVNDKEDIWESKSPDGITWSKSVNMGSPVNTSTTNNLIAVSADNNTLLFHTTNGFAFMHRTAHGWSALEDQGIYFNNESDFLEGCLSPDGKAILFVAKLKQNTYYRPEAAERDIYVCIRKNDGTWSAPVHTGQTLNSAGDEYSPFLSADGKTLYFASNGRPGYGDVDIFMSKRLSDGWTKWTIPVNLGPGINTWRFDAYYTLPASGEYGYMVSNVKSGLTDIIRFKLPQSIRPDPVVLVTGKVLNAKTQKPLKAVIRFDDLKTGKEVGEARSDPRSGAYNIVLPAGKNYGYHAAAPGYLSVNENLELINLVEYTELKKDLILVPIEIGESIQLKNVFFVQSKSELKPESWPELDRLVQIMKENNTMEIELGGHTDDVGDPAANLLLSEKRVEAVKNYLISKGIAPTRIAGKGYGGTRPVIMNNTEKNRQLNRRVEFKITKK